MFMGREVEGTSRDKTLFIKKGELQKVTQVGGVINLLKRHGVRRVYFGAGNVRGMTEVDALIAEILCTIGIEVLCEFDESTKEDAKHAPSGICGIFVCHVPTEAHSKIKVVKTVCDKKLRWTDHIGRITQLDDPEYNNDVEVTL